MIAWFSRPLSRLRYVAWGLALGALKTALDYSVAAGYRHPYSLLFYVSPVDAPLFHPSDDRPYWLALATVAMPFIAIGVALTARRLRDAAISPWFALLFFVPFANLLFFMTLALVPSRPRPMPVDLPKEAPYREPGAPRAAPPPPPFRRYPRLVAGIFGAVIGLGSIGISIGLLRSYGVALMLGTPTIAGFAAGAFYARLDPDAQYKGAAQATAISLALTMGVLVIFAIEGLGCLCMMFPLLVLPGFFGSVIGFGAGRSLPPSSVDGAIAASVLSFFLLLALERLSPLPPLDPPPVETALEVDAPPDRVWAELPTMPDMGPADDWVFRSAGIACPQRAVLHGEGVGAQRSCDFSTGPALETIDEWLPGRALGFTIDEQPDPMRELTLYHTVRQPHLDGYVRNLRGEFVVEALPGGRSRLVGRSWYRVRLAPESYWRLWGDFLLHKLHARVLRVVKTRAEAPPPHMLVRR